MKKLIKNLILGLGLLVLASNTCSAKIPDLIIPSTTLAQPAKFPQMAPVQPGPQGVIAGGPQLLAVLVAQALQVQAVVIPGAGEMDEPVNQILALPLGPQQQAAIAAIIVNLQAGQAQQNNGHQE